MTLKLLKLSYGEEILANVKKDLNGLLEVDEAVVIQPIADNDGNMQLQFVPWSVAMFAEDNVVVLVKDHIVAEAIPAEEIKERHSKIFGKIHVPEKKLII